MIESPAHALSAGDVDSQPADNAPNIPSPRSGSVHPTKIVLRALSAALCDQDVPFALDSSEDRQQVADIHDQQVSATWRQLRSRYTTAMAAGKLHTATVRATDWANTILERCGSDRQAFEPARLALIATLTRRLIVDGLEIARSAVDYCHESVSGLDGNATLSLPSPDTSAP